MNKQDKENNTPLSGERVPKYLDDNHIPSIVQTKSDVDLLKETAQDKRNLMRENNKLNACIAELEANIGVLQAFILELESDNDKLRDALEACVKGVVEDNKVSNSIMQSTFKNYNHPLPKWIKQAEQALKGKEVKGE